jgi:hypothetical protein
MRSQGNARHDHRSKRTQLDLFATAGGEALPTPAWGALPEEPRLALIRLMVRLILDHPHDARIPQPAEARHDV